MPRFRVTFRKMVYGNTGHGCAICQRIVDVDARDSASAETAAMQSFCDLENITHWLNHADWMEIALVNQPLADRAVHGGHARRAA